MTMRQPVPRLRTLLRWVWAKSRTRRGRMLLVCGLGMARVGCGLAFVWSSKRIVDAATGHLASPLFAEGAVACGLVLLQLLLSALETRAETRLSVQTANDFRRQCFSRLLRAEWTAARRYHTGDAVNRIEQDVASVVSLLATQLPASLVSGIQLVAAFVFFCLLDARLAWTTVVILPVCLLLSKVYFRRMRRYTRSIRESDSRIQAVLQEGMQHRTVLTALEAAPQRISLLDRLQQLLFSQVDLRTRFSVFSRLMVALGFGGAYLVAFLWGAHGLMTGAVTFGTMTAFLQLVAQIQSPAYSLAQIVPSVAHSLTSAERLRELELLPTEAAGEGKYLDAPAEVRLESVTFGYDDDRGRKDIFLRRSFCFPAGQSTAVLGPTGAGKTTLVRLLLALLRPQEGCLLICGAGQELAVSPQTRCNFVYVPQGNTLFSGTVRDNLLLANPAATEEQMREALRLAEADFVGELGSGLDTYLGENGGGLSEGQAQRLAIARSLLRPGRIMLFDEATSALDVDTESRLFRNLSAAYRGEKTLIFVTHRPHLAEQCDCVFHV